MQVINAMINASVKTTVGFLAHVFVKMAFKNHC